MGSSVFDDLTCVLAVSPDGQVVNFYSDRAEAVDDLRENCEGTWTLHTGDVTIRTGTDERIELGADDAPWLGS